MDRHVGRAAGGPAAGHRPRPFCRRHQFPAPASHAGRALQPRARPHRLDRCSGSAPLPGVVAVWTARRHRRRRANRFPRRADREARALSPAGAGARTACAMSASRSPRCSRRTRTSPRMPPNWSRVEIEELPPLLDARAEPGEFSPGRDTEAGCPRAGLRRHRGGVRAPRIRSSSWTSPIGRHSGVPLETRGAIGRYDAVARRAGTARRRQGAAPEPRAARAHARPAAGVGACYESPRRRRLRHPRRALSRGRAGLRRGDAARPAGEMDRGPPRASDRRQSFAPAAPPDPRRGRRDRAKSSRIDDVFFHDQGAYVRTHGDARRDDDLRRAAGPVPRAGLSRGRAISGSPTRRRPRPIARPAASRPPSCASG